LLVLLEVNLPLISSLKHHTILNDHLPSSSAFSSSHTHALAPSCACGIGLHHKVQRMKLVDTTIAAKERAGSHLFQAMVDVLKDQATRGEFLLYLNAHLIFVVSTILGGMA